MGETFLRLQIMTDTVEKIYCTGDGGNNDLATALAVAGRNNNDPMAMMAAMNLSLIHI